MLFSSVQHDNTGSVFSLLLQLGGVFVVVCFFLKYITTTLDQFSCFFYNLVFLLLLCFFPPSTHNDNTGSVFFNFLQLDVVVFFLQYITTTLGQFSRFAYIWAKDRDEELQQFLNNNPLLLDFRAQIKRYEELAESIMELPEYYDVGPISLLSGTLFERERYIYIAGTAQWLEHQTHVERWQFQVPAGVAGELSSPGSAFLYWLLFWYLFHPCVAAVAHQRSWSCCQKCRWQVTAKNTCTLHICGFAWSNTVHGCMVYTEHHLHKYTTSVDIPKMQHRKLVTHVESHGSTVSLLESRK